MATISQPNRFDEVTGEGCLSDSRSSCHDGEFTSVKTIGQTVESLQPGGQSQSVAHYSVSQPVLEVLDHPVEDRTNIPNLAGVKNIANPEHAGFRHIKEFRKGSDPILDRGESIGTCQDELPPGQVFAEFIEPSGKVVGSRNLTDQVGHLSRASDRGEPPPGLEFMAQADHINEARAFPHFDECGGDKAVAMSIEKGPSPAKNHLAYRRIRILQHGAENGLFQSLVPGKTAKGVTRRKGGAGRHSG